MSNDINEKWKALSSLCNDGHRKVIVGGKVFEETRPSESANLPFVLAYALLEDALSELINRGVFECNDWQLDKKMKASKPNVRWVNFDTVNNGKVLRNKLAHKARLLPKADCLKYIEAIGAELKSWQLIN